MHSLNDAASTEQGLTSPFCARSLAWAVPTTELISLSRQFYRDIASQFRRDIASVAVSVAYSSVWVLSCGKGRQLILDHQATLWGTHHNENRMYYRTDSSVKSVSQRH